MTEQDYRIETLGRAFASHAEIWNKIYQENIKESKEAYPDKKLQENLIDDFNISRALSVMCLEIEQLKNQLKGHLKNEHPFL